MRKIAIFGKKYSSLQFRGNELKYYRGTEEKPIDVSGAVVDYYNGPKEFNLSVLDCGSVFSSLIDSTVPTDQRIYSSKEGAFQVLGFTDSAALVAFEEITRIANYPLNIVREKGLDYVYMRQLTNICALLDKKILKDVYDLVIVPLRGGNVVASMIPFKGTKVLALECKRLPLKRKIGDFAYGMSVPDSQKDVYRRFFGKKDQLDGKRILVLEVALASGLTSMGILNELYQRKVKPLQVDVLAPVMTQRGIELLGDFSKEVKYKVIFNTAAIFYRLGNFYEDGNDSILTDDGKYVIGNATNILAPFIKYD